MTVLKRKKAVKKPRKPGKPPSESSRVSPGMAAAKSTANAWIGPNSGPIIDRLKGNSSDDPDVLELHAFREIRCNETAEARYFKARQETLRMPC